MTLRIQGQGHSSRSQSKYNTLLTHIPFVPCQSALPFLGYSYFKIWRWNFKVNVISELKVESHNVGPTFSRLTSLSFHVNRASHSWVLTFSKFDLETQGSRSWVWSQFKVTMWVWHPIDSHPFRSMSIGHPIPELRLFKQGKSEGFESCDRPIVRKRPIWVKISDVLYRVTLKFDGWPWKTIGHLSFAVSSFVQHFIAIGEFKLELQSGNAQFGSNSMIFRAVLPWNLTYDLEKQ